MAARIGAVDFVPNSLTAWLFRGSLRDIAVYDYALEPARIHAPYKAVRKRVENSGLVEGPLSRRSSRSEGSKTMSRRSINHRFGQIRVHESAGGFTLVERLVTC